MARSLVALVVALALAMATPVRAEVISTSEALALEGQSDARVLVDEYLSRDDVARELTALGVSPELARLRAEALSEFELQELAGRIEEAPAGGEAVLAVLGVTFLVLLILEWVGVIDIFKKI